MSEQKYSTIHYHSYLELEKILGAQVLRSEQFNEPAHEEMLFIITHQAYELWFKQIIHEITSVHEMFKKNQVDESRVGTAVSRLDRVEMILKLLIQQVGIIETMTPLDFLDFRHLLFPASGFQSFQFRMVESLLGLPVRQRVTYHNTEYSSVFQKDQQAILKKIYENGTLFEVVEDWLERTPFLKFKQFDFLKYYGKAVNEMIAGEQEAIAASEYLDDKQKKMRGEMLGSTDTYFHTVLDRDKHDQLKAKGEVRLSYEATLAALFIHLYRDEPILHMPFRLLTNLVDIDDLFISWRQRHAQMVLRMLGRKIGTGGSSGHEYLSQTAREHSIFKDFHNISTLLIPRSALPKLPAELKQQLSFYFTGKPKWS